MSDQPVYRKPDRYKAASFRNYNDKMPSRYDTCSWMKLCQIPLLDRVVVQELRPNIDSLSILDVGCATGRLLEQLALAGATRLHGADLAPRILEVARQKLARTGVPVELRTADAEDRLPWDHDCFDAVTLTGVLHHFFRPRDALAEIRRVLRPGGMFVVVDVCFFFPLRQLSNLALRVVSHDGDFHFYAPGQAGNLVTDSGFEVARTRRVGLSSYLVTAHKPAIR
jgi:ubiquinone/menaquinone biosynthesis C-methylase UbiE